MMNYQVQRHRVEVVPNAHLVEDVCAHGLSVCDNWLFVFSFSVPAVELYAPKNTTCGMIECSWWQTHGRHLGIAHNLPLEMSTALYICVFLF